MEELLARLHIARTELEKIATERKMRQQKFNETEEMVKLVQQEALAKGTEEGARLAVVNAALEKYKIDKIKTNPGYVVNESTEAEIKDPANLREWVIKNSPIMMVVDTKQVLSIATGDNNTIPADLVEVNKVEKVKISSKLEEFIKE